MYPSSRKAQLRWHTDDEPLHFDRGDLDHTFYAILSWSFGATRTFLVKHKRSGRIDPIVLSSGDVVCMNQNFQFQYLHWCVLLLLKFHVSKLYFSVPDEPNINQWRLNLTFRWIVNHNASSLGCRNDARLTYRPVFIPTSNFAGHLLGLTYQPKAREVRTEQVFAPGSVVTIVHGLLTKTPTEIELANFAIELLDNWFLIPTVSIPQHPSIKFMRGQPVGSFITKGACATEGNVVFSYLQEESDRVWLLCRETGTFHFVRPVAVVALQTLDRKVYLRSMNALRNPMNLSIFDRKRMSPSISIHTSLVSTAESVTDAAKKKHRSSRSRRHSGERRHGKTVPPGPWVHVLDGILKFLILRIF